MQAPSDLAPSSQMVAFLGHQNGMSLVGGAIGLERDIYTRLQGNASKELPRIRSRLSGPPYLSFFFTALRQILRRHCCFALICLCTRRGRVSFYWSPIIRLALRCFLVHREAYLAVEVRGPVCKLVPYLSLADSSLKRTSLSKRWHPNSGIVICYLLD
jgi:hypothetical protein